jgi:sigma-B regulation protein RsbU (phosphoserine phosphatase)
METELGKILVVDDNEMNRDMLSRRLSRKGHSVQVAEDGRRALESVVHEDFDLILLDIMMPGIDGYQVLEEIRESKDAGMLPIIMATAKDQSEDIVKALRLGANDYVTKPLDFPVVLARVQTQLSLKKAKDSLAAAYAKMKKDVRAAARFQHALLPTSQPETGRTEFAWRYQPCDELGGDALNVFQIDEAHVCFYLLDVSGHGVPSSLLSVTATRSLSLTSDDASLITRPSDEPPGYTISDPADVASRLNELNPMASNDNHYFTMVFAILNVETRQVRYVNAGHLSPILVRADGELEFVEEPNLSIGMFPVAKFKDTSFEMPPGSRLYFYSDALAESANAEEEQFGKERLMEAVKSVCDRPLDAGLDVIIAAVDEWQEGEHFDDDVSILALETV